MTDEDSGIEAILAHLKEHPQGVSVSEMAESLHINRNTAARYLDKLLIAGKIEMRNFGKAKVFYLSHRVPVTTMMNFSSDMVLVLNDRLEIMQANRATAEFCTCTPADLVGTVIYEGPARIFCQGELVTYLKQGMHGDTVREELVVETPAKSSILDLRMYPIALPDGSPGTMLLFEDISARVQAETTLAENEAMFRRIVETVQDVLWSVDADGIITYISPGIARVTGHRPEELEGTPLQNIIAPREAGRFAARMENDFARKHGFSLHEMPVIGSDGRKHYCDFTASPLSNDGFWGYSGAIHDISGRYEAELGEKRWRLFLDGVMENIPAIITVSDLKTGRYYYVNRDAERFFRLSRSELLNMRISDILQDLKSSELTGALEKTVAERQKSEVTAFISFGKKEVKVSARFVPMRLSADMEYIITIFFTE